MNKFKLGDRVRVSWLQNTVKKRGTVSKVGMKGEVHVWQDLDGAEWVLHESDLTPLTGLEAMKVGDEIDPGCGHEIRVLEVGMNSFLPSQCEEPDGVYGWITFTGAEKKGWELKSQSTPEILELTLDEIAAKFGRKPEEVRVKKETE